MILLLFSAFAYGAELPGEQVYLAPTPIASAPKEDAPRTSSKPRSVPRKVKAQGGNLPSEYLMVSNRQSTTSELIQPVKGSLEVFRGLKVGNSIELSVDHSVIAFPDEKAPVVASAQSGQFRGFKFIGESYLEPNSRRIFIDFTRVVLGDRIFNLKGVGVATNGQPGLSGSYHSREGEYFAGDFISSFVAGYFDGLVPRKTNAFGQIETDQTVDSAVKKGLSSGALSTAERFRQKLKKVPEFSELKGPFTLKILILDQAKSSN